MPASGQDVGVTVCLYCTPRQLECFVSRVSGKWDACYPLIGAQAANKASCRCAGRIDGQHLATQRQRGLTAFEIWFAAFGKRAKIKIICVKVRRGFARGPENFS